MRLNAATAPPLAYDREATSIGVLHIGPGAFHRAHQADYFDRLLAHDPRWAISAVSLRSGDLKRALDPQDGLYTLATLDEQTAFRVIGAHRERLVAPDPVRLAAPELKLVTLTITEKGYCLKPDGTLDLGHPDLPASAIRWLVEGLRRRREAGFEPLAVLSCDNLPDNGHRLRAAVIALAASRDPDLAAWIAGEVVFPCSMVDSITPATDQALKARVLEATGLEDAWPIQREAFTQWVVEDILPSGGPDLASVGVTLTPDVAAFEQAKLRLLNGAHSSLAYLGLLRGHETVAEAMADPDLAGFIETLMRQDIAPTLPGDQGPYIDAILKRFRNRAIRHRLSQIAWDGSQKLPIRLLATAHDALLAGRPVERLCRPLAGWMRFIERQARAGVAIVDPLAETLATVGRAGGVARFLELPVFPPALAIALKAPVEAAYDRLT
ncbi:fructuronate reductase [Caulobacter ginsengisoli]|uniref:Fructuronate reductase n=1 Tax=Caulobacter ginsengisoli TaxID=400775 RepID=A0ABU0ILP8_9CAUL|nr:mannitol dehydrogenase family protein [Caulobacter ginsengisoli]MDQ0462330.1 fructuronate reductase [Caulobacter ginsengisoli]